MRTTLPDSPFEEARLAEELARLMRRAPRPVARPKPRPRPAPRRPVPPGSTREALATLLVRHANPLTPSRLAVPRAEPAATPSAAELHANDGETSRPAASTADWLQRARRRRLRRRIAEAASWSLTVTVGALIIAAAVWMLLGWPNDLNRGQRMGAVQTRAAS
jgi:hypothetical protein